MCHNEPEPQKVSTGHHSIKLGNSTTGTVDPKFVDMDYQELELRVLSQMVEEMEKKILARGLPEYQGSLSSCGIQTCKLLPEKNDEGELLFFDVKGMKELGLRLPFWADVVCHPNNLKYLEESAE